jgi:hypothetical protein
MKRSFILLIFVLLNLNLVFAIESGANTEAYYPLTANNLDSLGKNSALTGSTPTYSSSGATYSGSSTYMQMPNVALTTDFTLNFQLDNVGSTGYALANSGQIGIFFSSTTNMDIYADIGSGFALQDSESFTDGDIITITRSSNQHRFYRNGVEFYAVNYALNWGSTPVFLARTTGGANSFATDIKDLSWWSVALTPSEVTDIVNNGIVNPPSVSLTTDLQEFYSTATPLVDITANVTGNLSYSVDGGSFTSICTSCSTNSLTLPSQTEGSHDLSIKLDYLGFVFYSNASFTVDTTSPTITNNLPSTLSSYFLDFNSSGCSDTNLLYCNLTINTTNYNLSAVSNATITNAGNITYSIAATDKAGQTDYSNGTIYVNPLQYFYFLNSATSTLISSFDFGAFNTSTDELSIPLFDLGLGFKQFNFIKFGFDNTTVNFTTQIDNAINLTTNISPVLITVQAFDSVNSSQVGFDITISNTTNTSFFSNQFDFSKTFNEVPTGNITIVVEASGYVDATFIQQFNPFTAIDLDVSLIPSTASAIVIFVVNDLGTNNKLENVTVEAQQLVNGTYSVVGQCLTDSAGQCFLQLDSSEAYKIIFTKDNYVTATANTIPTITNYNVNLQTTTNVFDFSDGLSYMFLPGQANIYTGVNTNFSAFVSGLDITLIEYRLYDDLNNTFYSDNSTNPTGATFTQVLNVSNSTNATKVYQYLRIVSNGESRILTDEYFIRTLDNSSFFAQSQSFANNEGENPELVRFFIMMIVTALSIAAGSQIIGGGTGLSLFIIPVVLGFAFLGWLPSSYAGVLTVGAGFLFLGGRFLR